MADVLAVTGRTPATQSPFVSAASLDATLSTASWEGDHTSWLAKTVPVSAPKVPHPGKTPSVGHTYFLPPPFIQWVLQVQFLFSSLLFPLYVYLLYDFP